ncbi:ComF family protein [Streptomyces sp. Tu 3180]|uniref:ComF family protein n=1 Tax=Streptomyces sp. Tu 3180 TaxID=2682611 RepID=UPI00135AE9B6|nr:ComF family protein [Streptomyces sp. Tu 3180]KAF3465747.1 ComF family protein [Streptomyces sp. Tu 3180]
MRGWWQDLTDLVLPAECGGCGRPRAVLCARCRTALGGAAPRRVRPVPEPAGLPPVHAAARYADEVRATLLAHKERGVLALAGPLGEALAGAVRAGLRAAGTPEAAADRAPHGRGTGEPHHLPGAVLLVPVPSARRAVRARGHDPARRIAFAAAGALRRGGVPARVLPALRQRRHVADQAGLDSRRRLANLAGALVVVPGCDRLLLDGPVVLVDDLMTTGASLAEAARAVRARSRAGGGPCTEPGAGPGAGPYEGSVSSISGAASVYRGETGEGRGEQRNGPARRRTGRWSGGQPGTAGAGGADGIVDVVGAAVVAASPDAFEINRN